MIFVDFDGTISKEDVCSTMVKKFAREGWEEINCLWEERALSTEECANRTLELMDVEPRELAKFFNAVDIDLSFKPFVNWTEHNNYPLYILSDGYDNYISEVLVRHGLKIPYYANHLEYEEGWRIRCLHLDKECKVCGVCKTSLVEELLKPGYTSVYIGDGYSDICPAEYCNIVFAKKHLARLCQEKSIPFYPYDNFIDVQRTLISLENEL
jgi:2,3-diketo-5-methylthio-1-phosphopentane phosphatase